MKNKSTISSMISAQTKVFVIFVVVTLLISRRQRNITFFESRDLNVTNSSEIINFNENLFSNE